MSESSFIIAKYDVFYQANAAFRGKYYRLATQLYAEAIKDWPILDDLARHNLEYALTKLESGINGKRIDGLINKRLDKSKLGSLRRKLLIEQSDLKGVNVSLEPLMIALNTNPFFRTSDAKILKDMTSGFYSVSFRLFADVDLSNQFARVYIDYGKGFNEQDMITLNLKEGLNERIIYIPHRPIAIRFDPLEVETAFYLQQMEVTAVDTVKLSAYFNGFFAALKYQTMSEDKSLAELYEKYDQLVINNDALDYVKWLEVNESDVPVDMIELEAVDNLFSHAVLFSIILPTYNTEEEYLKACIDSILSQSFTNFELCIADDASTNKKTVRMLKSYEQQDSRIKIVYRRKNGHISAASNSAIELATGRYLVFIDHDDKLAKNALYYCAQVISQQPSVQIIYSDEDKIDKEGRRYAPHFKSNWNLDLLFSQNYVSHLGIYDSGLIKRIGGFRVGVEGSQDYDLLLRCLPYTKDSQIEHIPRILYHWRAIEGSTATSSEGKSYTTQAGIKALQDYFINNGPKGVKVKKGKRDNTYKVEWPIPDPNPKVSLLIPTRDSKDITEQAVLSILKKTTYYNYEIVIIDNGSVEQVTLDFFKTIQEKDNRVTVIRYDKPFNYSAINNFGVGQTNGDIIGLINNDVEVINPEWLTEMVRHAVRPDIGCVGAKLYYGNGQIQHAGVILGIGGVAGHSHKYFKKDESGYFSRLLVTQNLAAVTAACLLVERDIYNEVGGLNETDLTVAFNDVDFCLRVFSAGYRNLWTPYAELYHHESVSRGAEDNPEKVARFNKEADYMKETWGEILKADPFYSPNLTKEREDFSISRN